MLVKIPPYLIVVLIVASRPAYAYFDTSTFWMVLQGGIAVVAGGLVGLNLYRKKIIGFIRKVKNRWMATGDGPE